MSGLRLTRIYGTHAVLHIAQPKCQPVAAWHIPTQNNIRNWLYTAQISHYFAHFNMAKLQFLYLKNAQAFHNFALCCLGKYLCKLCKNIAAKSCNSTELQFRTALLSLADFDPRYTITSCA